MKTFFVIAALVAVALAAPQGAEKDAVVVKSELDNIGVEGFNYVYETSNKISAQQSGQVINAGTDHEAVAVRGQFQYTAPDGVVYTVSYVADENGFQPEGVHLPQAPAHH